MLLLWFLLCSMAQFLTTFLLLRRNTLTAQRGLLRAIPFSHPPSLHCAWFSSSHCSTGGGVGQTRSLSKYHLRQGQTSDTTHGCSESVSSLLGRGLSDSWRRWHWDRAVRTARVWAGKGERRRQKQEGHSAGGSELTERPERRELQGTGPRVGITHDDANIYT